MNTHIAYRTHPSIQYNIACTKYNDTRGRFQIVANVCQNNTYRERFTNITIAIRNVMRKRVLLAFKRRNKIIFPRFHAREISIFI